MLYDTGSIKEEEMRKLKDLAKELKKETFEFRIRHGQAQGREGRGVTIDVMHQRLDTQSITLR
jgi:translation elongation factor EF-1alpha